MVDQVSAEASHAAARGTDFLDNSGTVYVLAGKITTVTGEEGADSHWILVGQGLYRPVCDEMLPLLEFFQTPRTAAQVRERLEWIRSSAPYGPEWLELAGDPGCLDELMRRKLVVAVDTRWFWEAVRSLRGLKLVPQAAPSGGYGGWTDVVPLGSQWATMFVGPVTVAVL